MRLVYLIVISYLTLLALSCAIEIPENSKTGMSVEELRLQANQLSQDFIIIDTHVDTPYRMQGSSVGIDFSVRSEDGDFDLVRAKEGGLNVAFMSIYIPASFQQNVDTARAKADQLIELVESYTAKWPDKCAVAQTTDEVLTQFEQGIISLPMGMENGAPIGEDLSTLRYFYDRGIRYITLTHSRANQICDSSYDEQRPWGGLSPFGKQVIQEMNRLGIMIDVSHVTDETFYQVLEISKAPVIASHSSCRYFTPGWERNMSDEMIQALAEKNGVIQINFGSMFLDNEYLENQNQIIGRIQNHLEENDLNPDHPDAIRFRKEILERYPLPEVDVEHVVKHINHVVEIAGINHVGLGSDFDGVGDSVPQNLSDVSMYPNLILELLKEGYAKEEIAQICGENLLRVWRDVENISQTFVGR